MSQYAYMVAGTIDSYSSSAFIKSNKAEGSQSAELNNAGWANFRSGSGRGVPEIYEMLTASEADEDEDANWIAAGTKANAQGAETIAYSAKSKSSSSEMTASQTLDIQNAAWASKEAYANSMIGDESCVADSNSYIQDYYYDTESSEWIDGPVGSLKGSDDATAKKNYAGTTSDVDAHAFVVNKGAWADYGDEDLGYYANTENWVAAYVDSGIIQTIVKGSDSATAKKGSASAGSQLDAKYAMSVETYSNAGSTDEVYWAHSESDVGSYVSEEDDVFLASVKNSDVATSKKDYSSVTSVLDASNADYITRSSTGSYGDLMNEGPWYNVESGSYVNGLASQEYNVEIPASMKGTETVTVKKNSASATQNIDAKGAAIGRWIEAYLGDEDRFVYAETYLFDGTFDLEYGQIDQYPAAASSLKGSSTATITSKDSSLTGSWNGYLAKDITAYPSYEHPWMSFSRESDGWNDREWAYAGLQKSSVDQAGSFSFKESANENNKGATAA